MFDPLGTLIMFRARVPGGVMVQDEARAVACLEDASALIRAVAGKSWDGEVVPDVIAMICIAVAKRAFIKPEMVQSEATVVFTGSFSVGPSAIWLTKTEEREVRRAGARRAVWTLPTTRADDDVADVPTVMTGAGFDPPAEELDPFTEGWPA